MSTTKCPYCAEEIQAEAVKCKHCGSWLSGPPEGALAGEVPAGTGAVKRLMRSSSDKMIAGVCGGIARYFGIDSTIVRILVPIITVFTGIFPGVVVYIVMAFVVPSDESLHLY